MWQYLTVVKDELEGADIGHMQEAWIHSGFAVVG